MDGQSCPRTKADRATGRSRTLSRIQPRGIRLAKCQSPAVFAKVAVVFAKGVVRGARSVTRLSRPASVTARACNLCWLLCRSASSCGHLTIVMASPKYGHRIDLGALAIDLARAWNGDSLTNPLMRAASIEIAQTKFFENPPQVASPENDDVIQAFAPDPATGRCANGAKGSRAGQRIHVHGP